MYKGIGGSPPGAHDPPRMQRRTGSGVGVAASWAAVVAVRLIGLMWAHGLPLSNAGVVLP
jgi:hypothetical protein